MGTVLAAYAAVCAFVSRRSSLFAAAFVAVTPLVWFSQEALDYALLMFLGKLSLSFFQGGAERRSREWLACRAVISSLAVAKHNFAVFPVARLLPVLVVVAVRMDRWPRASGSTPRAGARHRRRRAPLTIDAAGDLFFGGHYLIYRNAIVATIAISQREDIHRPSPAASQRPSASRAAPIARGPVSVPRGRLFDQFWDRDVVILGPRSDSVGGR